MNKLPLYALLTAGGLLLAGGSGFLTSTAMSSGQDTKTVTIDQLTGPAGDTGPRGPQGERGPTGPRGEIGSSGLVCPKDFDEGLLVINTPGGQVKVWTCLGN